MQLLCNCNCGPKPAFLAQTKFPNAHRVFHFRAYNLSSYSLMCRARYHIFILITLTLTTHISEYLSCNCRTKEKNVIEKMELFSLCLQRLYIYNIYMYV